MKVDVKAMTAKDYMNLPYSIIIQERDELSGKYYYGKVLELEGCFSDGETIEELHRNIREAMELWLEESIQEGDNIPLPVEENHYSGRFNLRIPKSLHQRLAIEAKREGVSLNQYALYKLAL